MKKILYLAVATSIALASNAQTGPVLRAASPNAMPTKGAKAKKPVVVMTREQFEAEKSHRSAGVSGQQTAAAQPFAARKEHRGTAVRRADGANYGTVIETPPEGTAKYYTRSGYSFFPAYGYREYEAQKGHITIVYCDNNEVYIQDPVMNFKQGTWVKGIKDGNTITVATRQALAYAPGTTITASLRWATVNEQGEMLPKDRTSDHFTFTIDGDKISLEGTSVDLAMCVIWDDNDEGTGYGDFSTVWTHDPEFVPTSTDPIVPPKGMEVLSWFAKGERITMMSDNRFKEPFAIGFDGNDVYMRGVFAEFPDAWIKGTIEDGVATFPKLQYQGRDYERNTWAVGVRIEGYSAYLEDFKMSYDAATRTFTALNELWCNASDEDPAFVERVVGLQVMPEDPYGKPVTIPYYNSLEKVEQMDEFTIIDANSDGLSWEFREGEGVAYVNNNSPEDADDWFITRGISLKAGSSYTFAFKARSAGYPEDLEVKMGTAATVEAMTMEVIPAMEFSNFQYATIENERITVPEDGVYYFGIHAISGAEDYAFYINRLKVDEGLMPKSPMAVQNLTYTPAEDGSNYATMTFDAPTRDISGNALNIQTGGALTVKIWRNDELVKTLSVLPGQTGLSYRDDVPEAGNYEYKLMTYMGSLRGEKQIVGSWVGLDIPGPVTNIKLADNSTSITGYWDAISDKGAHGGIVFPDKTTYNFCEVEELEIWDSTIYIIGAPINEEPITDTQFTFDRETCDGVQHVERFAVQAENAAGKNSGYMAKILMGTPYEMTMREPFNAGMRYYWDYTSTSYLSGAYLSNDPSDGDAGNLEFYSAWADEPQHIVFESGKIAMGGAINPAILFDAKKDGMSAETFKVFVQTNGMKDAVEVADLSLTKSYKTYKVMLADYKDAEWFRFFVEVDIDGSGIVSMDNLIITDLVKNNASISLSAPTYMNVGENAKLTATVTNGGEQDVEGYAVRFYADQQLIKEYTSAETKKLTTGMDAEYEAVFETSIFEGVGGDVKLCAELVYDDLKPEDNISEHNITVFVPQSTPVSDVEANANVRMMEVKWTAPEDVVTEYVETFESFPSNSIYADGEYCGDWKAVDVSKGKTYTWQSADINWPHAWEVFAFGVINMKTTNLEKITGRKAFSGVNTAVFFSETNEETGDDQPSDRYMISPELPGMAQTIMFHTCIITNAYGAETFEVLVSSTDTELSSFTKLQDFSELVMDWQLHVVDLPEGTKYFAIRYTSPCCFGLYVDDIRYTTDKMAPTGYNIYLDQEKVGTAKGDATSFVYNQGVDMSVDHTAAVTALYGVIESAPVSVKIGVLGIETITADDAANSEAIYYSVSGVRVPAASLTPGVYLRVRGNTADKVIVK
ncbi:MAG: hypothetical protein HUK14_03710 [Muribaculaceae bacterium]|nr:hypothetical protein [Muribaculaceae bacterium]